MTLRIRASLLYYHRDSYVAAGYTHEGNAQGPGAPDGPFAPDGGGTIDCASGFVRFGAARVLETALRNIDPRAVSRYPEVAHETLLKPAILERFRPEGLGPAQLFLGHGSFNLIERVIHKLLQADGMLGVGPQFSEVPSEFQEAGGSYQAFPLDEAGFRLPVAELEEALAGRPVSIVYVDNPNNPLGQLFDPADLERLAHACDRRGAVLLVDEAWGDYVDDAESAIHLAGRFPNVAVVRSFSKALGLAGERVGYMFLSEPLAKYYRQVDIPVRADDRGSHPRARRPRRTGPHRRDPPGGGRGQGEDRRGLRRGRAARPPHPSERRDHGRRGPVSEHRPGAPRARDPGPSGLELLPHPLALGRRQLPGPDRRKGAG